MATIENGSIALRLPPRHVCVGARERAGRVSVTARDKKLPPRHVCVGARGRAGRVCVAARDKKRIRELPRGERVLSPREELWTIVPS